MYRNSGSNLAPCALKTVPGFHRSGAGRGRPGVGPETRTDILCLGLNIYGEEERSKTDLP